MRGARNVAAASEEVVKDLQLARGVRVVAAQASEFGLSPRRALHQQF